MATLTNTVAAADVQTGITLVRTLLAEQYPSADTAPGTPVDGLVVQPQGYLAALHTARANEALLLGSIAAITSGLVTATDADVDALAGNYFLTRVPASYAGGLVKIIVSSNTTYVVPLGFTVGYSTLLYTTSTVHRIYPTGTLGVTADAYNKVLTARSDGSYEFTITVTASQAGATSRLGRGAALTLVSSGPNLTSASVDTDFTGGSDAESNSSLLARASAGITQRAVAGPAHTLSLLQASYPSATLACIGVGSPLMVRDRGNLLGISTGGRQDIYVRASQTIGRQTVRLSGTVTNISTKTVSLTIPRPTSDGLHRVVAIRPAGYVGVGGITPTSQTPSYSANTTFVPTLLTTVDLAGTAYQSVAVTFLDTLGTGPYVLNEVRSYDLDLVYTPDLSAITTLLADTNRPAGCDVLVKGAVPALMTVLVTIRMQAGAASPDTAILASAIANALNGLPLGTATFTSFTVLRAVAALLPNGEVTAVSYSGSIYGQDGSTIAITPTQSVTIPTSLTPRVSPANTAIYCSVSDIAITVT